MEVTSSAVTSKKVKSFLGRTGHLKHWQPNYEFRQGQLEMAEAIEEVLQAGRHLLVEAGTGTGKTLAYLLPAILSGKRVIISTGTKNLQEQLYLKDVPFLEKHFPNPLRVSYMKGRANYVCRQKVYDAEKEPILSGMEEVSDFKIIQEWEKTTKTGDRAEIKTLPESSTAWAKLDSRRELCTGSKCQQFERCFITEMQRKAYESDIIIVNHHLFFADLAVKDTERGSIIPDYDAVIFDEAHDIEDVAGQYFGLSISTYQIQEIKRDISALARRKNFGSQEIDRALMMLEERAAKFFDLFPPNEGRTGFNAHQQLLQEDGDVYYDLQTVLELTSAQLQLVKNAPEEVIAGRFVGDYDNGIGRKWKDPNFMKFFEDGKVNFPYLSDGMWFLTQHKRWGLLKADPDYLAVATKINQVKLYSEAASQLGISVPKEPTRSTKLMDGVVWDGKNPAAYAASFKIRA